LHAELPPLPGHKEHRCTDIPWLAAFLGAVALQGVIGYLALAHGDLRKLSRGYNYKGELCGVDTGGLYLFHCEEPTDGTVLMVEPICVPACPAAGNGTHSCFNPEVDAMQEYPDYDTISVLNFCLPASMQARAQFIHSKLGNSTLLSQNQHTLRMARRMVMGWISMIKRAWLPLLIAANLATVVGYVYILALDRVALQLMYACEIVVTCGSWYVGYKLIDGALHGGSDGIKDSGDSLTDIMLGLACICVGFLACLVSLCINRTIPTAVGCIEAACECMFQEPTLLLEPFLSLASKVMVVLVYTVGILHLVSCGEMLIPKAQHNGFLREFSYTPLQYCALAFSGFMFLWILELCHACSHYTLAWTTQMWYFTPYVEGAKVDRKPCLVFAGYMNALRYHLGSLALGGLCSLLFRIPRYLLGPLATAAGNKKHALGRSLSLMCPCCIKWYWDFLAKLKQTSYMDIAITSSNYWPAAGRALDVITNEVPSVSVLNGAQFVFQIALLGLTCYTGFFATWIMTVNISIFSLPQSAFYIEDPKLVAVIAAVLSGLVGVSFMLVFDTVGDTILYCYASEQRRRRKVDTLRYKDDDGTVGYFSCFGRNTSDEDEERRIRYAPQRLRELIETQDDSGSDS